MPSALTRNETFRPLTYSSFSVPVDDGGVLRLHMPLRRWGYRPDADLPVKIVRAVRYSDSGTFGPKRQHAWATSVLEHATLSLRVHGPESGRVVGSVLATAVARADDLQDRPAGVLFTRPELSIEPQRAGVLDVREPFIELPGVSSRFREYTLLEIDHRPEAGSALRRMISIDAERYLQDVTRGINDLRDADKDTYDEIMREIARLQAQLRKPWRARLGRIAIEGALRGLVAALAAAAARPYLGPLADQIDQLVEQGWALLHRYFG